MNGEYKVIESGVGSNGLNYEVFTGNICHYFGSVKVTATSSTASGNGYYSNDLYNHQSIPFKYTLDKATAVVTGTADPRAVLINAAVNTSGNYAIFKLYSGAAISTTANAYNVNLDIWGVKASASLMMGNPNADGGNE